jgi:hypothetical protein
MRPLTIPIQVSLRVSIRPPLDRLSRTDSVQDRLAGPAGQTFGEHRRSVQTCNCQAVFYR